MLGISNGIPSLYLTSYFSECTDILCYLKEDESASVDKPPHHRLFDPVTRSPVLQCCLDAQNAKGPVTSSAPVFNITVGDGLIDLLRPARPAPPDAFAPQMLAGPSIANNMLLKPTNDIGPDMSISDFCTSFGL